MSPVASSLSSISMMSSPSLQLKSLRLHLYISHIYTLHPKTFAVDIRIKSNFCHKEHQSNHMICRNKRKSITCNSLYDM